MVFGWPEQEGRLVDILKISDTLSNAGISTVIAKLNWRLEPGQPKHIHLWWSGRNRNGDLMLLLAHLLSQNEPWIGSTLIIQSIVPSEVAKAMLERQLKRRLPRIRIKAQIRVHIKEPDELESDIIERNSNGATVTFLGLTIPRGDEREYFEQMQRISRSLREQSIQMHRKSELLFH